MPKMRTQIILTLSSLFLPLISAQQSADGLIVPFTSGLPSCASQCGKLFDVQGGCTPPAISQISSICFCSDTRLDPFNQDGTGGVSSVCGAASCTDTADLQKIKTWYQKYCNEEVASTTTTSGATTTATGANGSVTVSPSKPKNKTWLQSHYQWVIFLVVVTVGIIGIWVGAYYLRKHYLRKKEREFEMRPPVAWGPHQMQNQTGGYNYGDGVIDANAGGRTKEAKMMAASATPAGPPGAKSGWLRKGRS